MLQAVSNYLGRGNAPHNLVEEDPLGAVVMVWRWFFTVGVACMNEVSD